MSIDPESFQVSIQKFSPRGYGLAHLSRPEKAPIEVEIAHTIPGDEVRIEMRRKMRPPRKGRLLEVVSPAKTRVEPRCSHARVCGGCSWQQMDYAAQLKVKQALVSRLFGRETKPIISCEDPFEYRNKMEFTFSENRAGQKFLGLMIAQAEPYVFNVAHCHLCKVWFSDVLQAVRSWWESSQIPAYHPARDAGALRYLTLRESQRTGQKMVVLNVANRFDLSPEDILSFIQAVKMAISGEDISIFLRIHEANKGKPTEFRELHLSGPDHILEELHIERKILSFKISPSSFFQPNTLQAEKLYTAALSHLSHLHQPVIYDLYCGTGTLGMIASQTASQVIGIELSVQAVLDARENATRNQIDKITFHQGDVGKVLTQLMGAPTFQRPDAVILDPPRAGLDPLALHHVKTLKPKAILYISCNPLTQAANVQQLLDFGYTLHSLQPVDQFPHTYHIENIAYLER